MKVYNPPANDGGGAFEVAGINVRWHADKATQLKKLIEEGHHEEAEAVAREYVLSYTAPISGIVSDAGLEFYLRDSYFDRGPGSAIRILQRALRVEDDGVVGPITRAALAQRQPTELLTALRQAREDYERNVVGFRENFWRGLVNRWDKALDAARHFQKQAQQEPVVSEQQRPPQTPPVSIPQPPLQFPDFANVGVDPKKMQDVLQVAMIAMLVVQMMQGKQVQLPTGLTPQGQPTAGPRRATAVRFNDARHTRHDGRRSRSSGPRSSAFWASSALPSAPVQGKPRSSALNQGRSPPWSLARRCLRSPAAFSESSIRRSAAL